MTQAELQDLAFTANALAANYIAILVTLISGYLIVAYTAGARLQTKQVALVNVLYGFTASLFLYAAMACYYKQMELLESLKLLAPDNFYPAQMWIVVTVGVVFSLVIIASVRFMWDVRHPKTK